MKKLVLCGLVVALLSGCTDGEFSKFKGLGENFKIEMYSGGSLVRTWVSTGKVSSESSSDGYFFKDKETGKLVEVSGDVVITEI